MSGLAVEHRPAERLKFFTDAVVAIAMTLLILPLLDSVSEAASEGLSTRGFVSEHRDQVLSFALSFLVISRFWMAHHSLFEKVEHYTPLLLHLGILWMFTIVWLPVPTAMAGEMDTDPLQLVLYIGTMLASTLVMVACHLQVMRQPETWAHPQVPGPDGLAAAIALSLLFAVALLLALVLPIGYLALLVLLLTRVVRRLVARRLGA
jgi:uncharacterized membrane protein